VPRLWTETVESHRHEVREAILDAAECLVVDGGLLAVTMSKVAAQAGIGRATLYKYFADVEDVLIGWHERQVTRHLQTLADLRDQVIDPRRRLRAVLEGYAGTYQHRRERGNTELVALLHRRAPIDHRHEQLVTLIRDLIADEAQSGAVRSDVSADELARYAVNALAAANDLASAAAIRMLVAVVMDGLAVPPPGSPARGSPRSAG